MRTTPPSDASAESPASSLSDTNPLDPRPFPAAPDPTRPAWRPDDVDGFEATTLPLTRGLLSGESTVDATLVRRTLHADPRRDERARAVLSVPGWNDYFFAEHVAAFFEAHGFTFYALDPRRSGRSLRDPAYRDYVTDLADYAEELDAAAALVRATHGSLTVLAHSTGGLWASLWAADRPGTVDAVVLNSPWITMWGPPGYGRALLPVVTAMSRRDPFREITLPDPGDRYAACIHASLQGEWDYDLDLKAVGRVPIRAGWLRGVLLGHRRIDAGLGLDVPVFVGCSTRSFLKARGYSELARTSDIVLDADRIAAKAHLLGRSVTVERIPDGFHDLTLSVPSARQHFFAVLGRWLDAYVPDPS